MKISVVIPVYNRPVKVQRALDSVLGQTEPPQEVIVVDDGSTDHTSSVLEGYRDEIIVIRHTQNRGVSAARNTGIEQAGSEWIAFLDSDDAWAPDKLEQNRRYFASNPGYWIFQNQEIWIRNGRRVNPGKKHTKHAGRIFRQSLPLCIISPSAVVIHKNIFAEVGLFDEEMPVCEDYDLWLWITQRYPVGLDTHPGTIKYGGHADQLSRSTPAMDYWRIRAMKKHLENPDMSEEDQIALIRELVRKLTIYTKGAVKRSRPAAEETKLLEKLLNQYMPKPR